jgi:hypothetical protein
VCLPAIKESVLKQIRKRFTYANVMSSLAVFLVLGGATAFAATKIGANQLKANSVKTGKIVKEAVTAGKIKKNAVTESKIADGAVTTSKLAAEAVTGAKANESTFGEVPSAKNAKTLDGIAATAFSRQARAFDDANALVGVSGTAVQASINAPQGGFILMIASADVFGAAAPDTYNCILNVDGDDVDSSRRESAFDAASPEEDCSTNAIVPVTSGSHNVKFNFSGIAATTTVDETELDVVFIPFAG